MNNPYQHHAPGVSVLASPQAWIEGAALQQLTTTARLPGMRQVVGMPDLHPGRGYPVGAAFFSVGHLYPALVGNDIGCGMAVWQTDQPSARARLDKLERQWTSIDGPLDDGWAEAVEELGLSGHPHRSALGTIGGGNHFAELLKFDTIHDAEAVAGLGLVALNLVLLVHSGSRGLGEAILRQHTEQWGHAGLAEGTASCAGYLSAHDAALGFAQANRRLIAERTLRKLKMAGTCRLDVHHNLVSPASVGGEAGWLHRKGATPSDKGCVLIPGSRGDHSYLVAPTASEASLFSLAHGAGRKWMRTECKGRLSQRHTIQSLTRTELGGRVICEDRSLIFEEAPEAYKDIERVVQDLVEAGVARVLARLTPVLTYKTRKDCCP